VNGSPVFTNVVQVNPLVNTSYTVTAVNAVGCNLFSGVTVSMLPVPGVTASLLPAIICKGEKSTLNLSGTAQAYSVNTVASPLTVTVNPTSTAVYTVDGTGSNGCTGKTTATITVNLCTEIGEEATEGLAVYPNPSNGTFTLQASVDAGVIIYDQLGKITRLFRTARGGCEVQGLAPGLYLITTGPFKKKIIVAE